MVILGRRGLPLDCLPAAGYVHFRVTDRRPPYHRLATIAPQVTTPRPRPAKKPLPPLPLFEQRQEDWLP
jgi:hypothetical protein